jgi:hypothetical protein
MRSESFHASAHNNGGLSEILLGIVAVLSALVGLGIAIDVDVLLALVCLGPPYLPTCIP